MSSSLPDLHTGRTQSRRTNEQLVLATIFEHGPLSRVNMAGLTGLSKPTVSSVVDELVDAGLVHQEGRTSGRVGPTAALYRVDGKISNVVAVDLGGTKVAAALSDLYGNILAERTEPTRLDDRDALLNQVAGLARNLTQDASIDWSSVRALAVGVPGTVDPESGRIRLAHNIPDFGDIRLADELATLGDNLHVVIENDVNAAAVGEQWQGWAKGSDNFAFVAIGTGIGAGLVVNGELCRGLGGAAGEIAYLPFGADPFDPSTTRHGPLEAVLGGRSIADHIKRRLATGAVSQLTDSSTAADAFAAAASGDSLAAESVERVAQFTAMTIAALSAIVAPELVILGGGIGANETLLTPVRGYSKQLIAQPPRIEQSALGPRAALVGALALGLESARHSILSNPLTTNTVPSGAAD